MEERNLQKDINMNKIRSLAYGQEGASKSEMTRETGLSFPTVTRIVDALCESGELIELGQGDSTGGRPSARYGLNFRFSLFLLIRIEGMELSWSIKDLAEEAVEEGNSLAGHGMIEKLDELIRMKEKEYPSIKAISIGIAGMVTDGMVVDSYTSEEMKGINLLTHFKNLTDTPVQLQNDMNLTALGGWWRSKERPTSSVAIYLGKTCFGAGIVLGGEVWAGACDFAGELGYLPSFGQELFRMDGKPKVNEITEHYITLIRIYVSVINPEQIILYENSYIKGEMDEIRKRCVQCLPEKAVPGIELSDNYKADYEKGLYAMARKIMKEG